MGTYEKIIMEFQEPFWPADVPFIGCCCPQPSLLSPPIPSPAAAAAAGRTGSTAAKPAAKQTVSASCTIAASSIVAAPLLVAPNDGLGATAAAPTASGSSAPMFDSTAAVHHHSAAVEDLAPGCPLPAIPVLLENYLWSKGVPVLMAAVTGERARMVAASSASAAAAVAGEEGGMDDGNSLRASYAREMYYRLIKPALVKGLCGDGEELPEPVSVFVTRRVTLEGTSLKFDFYGGVLVTTQQSRFGDPFGTSSKTTLSGLNFPATFSDKSVNSFGKGVLFWGVMAYGNTVASSPSFILHAARLALIGGMIAKIDGTKHTHTCVKLNLPGHQDGSN